MAGRVSTVDYYRSEEGLGIIKEVVCKGGTLKEVCDYIGVSSGTLYNWKNKYPEIRAALEAGMERQEEVAVGSLFKLIGGYYDEEVTVERYKLNGKYITDDPKYPVKEVTKKKFVPPNMGAIAFFLKCKRGWKEKQDVDVSVQAVNPFQGLSTEELREMAYRKPVARIENDVR